MTCEKSHCFEREDEVLMNTESIWFKRHGDHSMKKVAVKLSEEHNVSQAHIYWIAKHLGIYPEAACNERLKTAHRGAMGFMNPESKWVTFYESSKTYGLTDDAVKEIEKIIVSKREGKEWFTQEEKRGGMDFLEEVQRLYEYKNKYESLLSENDKLTKELEAMVEKQDEYEIALKELTDTNSQLMQEKKDLGKMQEVSGSSDYQKIMENLGKYKTELNQLFSDNYEIQKQAKALQTKINALDERRNTLSAGLASIYKEAKKLNLNGFEK